MKHIKLSNSFFLMFGLFSLVVALGTGCGSSSGSDRPPSDPEGEPPGDENIDDGTLPDEPSPR